MSPYENAYCEVLHETKIVRTRYRVSLRMGATAEQIQRALSQLPPDVKWYDSEETEDVQIFLFQKETTVE